MASMSKRLMSMLSSLPSLRRPLVGVGRRWLSRSDWNASKSRSRTSRKSPFIIGLLVLMPIVSFGLGTWQVQRLKWKQNLIAAAETHLGLPPLELPVNVNSEAANSLEFSFRRVHLRGKWDHQHEMLVGPRLHNGQIGYFVVTPFIRKNGRPLLIQRGWISKAMGDDIKLRSALARPTGEVDITGLLQTKPQKNWATPESHPEQGMYYFMDIDEMARQTDSQPIYIKQLYDENSGLMPEEMAMQGVPIGVPAKAEFRNSHFQYIMTWYGLGILTTVGLIVFLKQRRPNMPGDALRAKLTHAKKWQ